MELTLEITRIISAAIGAYYLYREVKIAHTIEESKNHLEKEDTKKIIQLVQLRKQDFREFFMQSIIYSGLPEKLGMSENELKALYDNSSNEELQKISDGFLDAYNHTLDHAENSLQYLHKRTSDSALKQRKLLLNMGIILILVSCAIDLYLRLQHL